MKLNNANVQFNSKQIDVRLTRWHRALLLQWNETI